MDADDGGGILSRVGWSVRGSVAIRLGSLFIADGRYLVSTKGNGHRVFSLLRVRLSESPPDAKLDYSSSIKATLQQQRMKGLFDGLHRTRIPFLYLILVRPADTESDDAEDQIFEFDLVVGTWADGRGKDTSPASKMLEQNINVLAASLSVGVPNASVRRLTRNELRMVVQSLLLPVEPKLPQLANSSTLSTLESFEGGSPMVGGAASIPDFYIPNAAESGKSGILIGRVKARSGEMHDFRIQLDDLKTHLTLLGVTGAGKSTTAAVLTRQLAGLGLPVMVLDWHNEHGSVIRSVGGTVVSPSVDSFTLNPLEFGSTSDPVEHIALVTDIFSDIYKFTHPQAFMFRNSLQKCLSEASDSEVPNLTSLVRIIEGYPLRSAYDNETKVALLRRLVPLTQGQAGRALDGPSTYPIEELLDKVLCVELGHMRDLQTRSIFANILLKMIYENRLTREGRTEHIMLVEEARNIAPARREEDPPSVGERMISELRKFGEAMIFVAQFPTQVSSEIIKNSGLRIVHRLAWAEDLKLIGQSLNLTPEQLAHISNLGVGEVVVSLARLQRPILVQVSAESVLSVENRDLSLRGES